MTGKRRKSWLITLPLLGMLMVSGLWVAYWIAAREIARKQVAGLPERGLDISCAQTTWAGFPFRFTFVCDQAEFRLANGTPKLQGTATRLSASALAYRPRHLVLELAPPFQIDAEFPPSPSLPFADSISIIGEKSHLRAGIKVGTESIKEFSLKAQSWAGRIRASKAGQLVEDASLNLGSVAAYWSPAAGAIPGHAVSIALTDAIYAGRLNLSGGLRTVNLETGALAATLTHWPADGRGDFRSWQARGGALEIARLAAKVDGRETDATGTVKLDDKGRLNGRLNAAVNDMAGLFQDLVAAGALKPDEATLASATIGLLSGQTVDPRPGWTVMPVILSKGRVYVGPFRLARLKPFF